VKCYAYDVIVLEVLQFVFYCFVLQEDIQFNIVSPLVTQDLTKNLEEFSWESFEVWLDSISASLIAYQDKESRVGASLGGKKVESSKSSSFLLPYPWGIPNKDPDKLLPKEKRKAYPTDGPSCCLHEELSVAQECKQTLPKEKAEDAMSYESNSSHT